MKFKKLNAKKITMITLVLLSGGAGLYFGGYQFLSSVFSSSAGSGAVLKDGDDKVYDLSEFRNPDNCSRVYSWGGRPVVKDELVNKRSLFLCRSKYATQYDPKIKVPLWTLERINKKDFVAFNVPASFGPSLDPELPKRMQSTVTDYTTNGLAFGFLSPIENAYINSDGTPVEQLELINRKSLQESFYLTNSIPETLSANRVRKEIDDYYRALALNPNYSELYSISGPVYLNGTALGFIGEGEDKMAVPTHYYKILTNPLNYGTDAYLIPNENNLGNKDNYKISLNEIERLTGIRFFSDLDPVYAAQVRQDPNEFYIKKKP